MSPRWTRTGTNAVRITVDLWLTRPTDWTALKAERRERREREKVDCQGKKDLERCLYQSWLQQIQTVRCWCKRNGVTICLFVFVYCMKVQRVKIIYKPWKNHLWLVCSRPYKSVLVCLDRCKFSAFLGSSLTKWPGILCCIGRRDKKRTSSKPIRKESD